MLYSIDCSNWLKISGLISLCVLPVLTAAKAMRIESLEIMVKCRFLVTLFFLFFFVSGIPEHCFTDDPAATNVGKRPPPWDHNDARWPLVSDDKKAERKHLRARTTGWSTPLYLRRSNGFFLRSACDFLQGERERETRVGCCWRSDAHLANERRKEERRDRRERKSGGRQKSRTVLF